MDLNGTPAFKEIIENIKKSNLSDSVKFILIRRLQLPLDGLEVQQAQELFNLVHQVERYSSGKV